MFIRLKKDAPQSEANALDSVLGLYRFYVGE